MHRLCPKPAVWSEVFNRLRHYAEIVACVPPSPPTPLILNGWMYSNDVQKEARWKETVDWAVQNGCDKEVNIPDSSFYCVDAIDTMTDHEIGPLGGPMYLPWSSEEKARPTKESLDSFLKLLSSNWERVAGLEMSRATEPVKFSGAKARCLWVRVHGCVQPTWGSWDRLSSTESERRSFTKFREAINNLIAPHTVDHVEFLTELPLNE